MIISVLLLLTASLLLARLLRLRHRVEFLLAWSLILPTLIFFLALALSAVNALASVGAWIGGSLVVLALIGLPLVLKPALRAVALRRPAGVGDLLARVRRARLPLAERIALILLSVTIGITGAVNLLILVTVSPSNLDALSYHLARMAYYLQHGNLNFFDANYWAIVTHPKVATVQVLYTYLAAGRNENLTGLPQYLAYWTTLAAVYGIARLLGGARRGAALAAGVSGLFVITLMEAVTAQNDLLLTAFAGAGLYFLLAYREARRREHLLLAILGLALALGVKATMLLAIPSLLVVGALLFLRGKSQPAPKGKPARRAGDNARPADLRWAVGGALLAIALIVLPAGYWDNLQRFGSLTGPAFVNEAHSAATSTDPVSDGLRNVLRYSLDFVRIDGFFPTDTANAVEQALQIVPQSLFEAMGLGLEAHVGERAPFLYRRLTPASEDSSYWGLLGFALVWPVVLIFLCRRDTPLPVRLFAAAAVLYVLVQAFASPYDVWRGRYFITAALFAAPPLAFAFGPRSRWRPYLLAVVVLGCVSALSAVMYRDTTLLLPMSFKGQTILGIYTLKPPPRFRDGLVVSDEIAHRMAYLTRKRGFLYPTLARFDQVVPAHATIAVDLGNYGVEYLYFGKGLTRTLIPVRTFDAQGQWTSLPIPPATDYLIVSEDSPNHLPGDSLLFSWVDETTNKHVFYRRLKP